MLAAVAVRPEPLPDPGPSLRPRLPLRHFTMQCSARSLGDPTDDALAEAFVAEIFRAHRVRLGRCDGLGAAVSAVVVSRAPRCDRTVHAIVLDGVITRGHGEPRLWPIAEAPGEQELRAVARRVQARMLAWTGPAAAEHPRMHPMTRLRTGRVPRIQQALVEGPPLAGVAGEPGPGSGPHPGAGPDTDAHHGGPRLRVRLSRPLSGGTTHAVLSTRALLHRLRAVLGDAAPVPVEMSGCRAHGLLWPVPKSGFPRAQASPTWDPNMGPQHGTTRDPAWKQVSRRPGPSSVRPLRDVAP